MSFLTVSQALQNHISSHIPEVKHVGDLITLSHLHDRNTTPPAHQLPAVYVFPEKTTAEPHRTIGQPLQEVTLHIGILITLSAQKLNSQNLHTSSLSSLDTLHHNLIQLLIGFHHTSWPRSFSPLIYSSSELHDFSHNLILWKQSYHLSLFSSPPSS